MVSLWLLMGGHLHASGESSTYQVWAADQNGNVFYILDRDGNVLRSLNVAEIAGADRPHLIVATPDRTAVFSANTVSNSISIHRVPDGALVAVVEKVGKAPHAAQPNPYDPTRVYVSNIAPRGGDQQGSPDKGETITEVVREGGAWRVSRYLDLKNATVLADDQKFPSRRPVLVGFSPDGRYMVVSLFNGGLAVVDLKSWEVVDGFGKDQVAHHATVVYPSPNGKELYVGSGNQAQSWLYVIDVSGKPKLVATHDLSPFGQDAHGMAIDPIRGELWLVHRASSTVTIHPLTTLREKHTPHVIAAGGKAPDMIEISSDGRRAYLTLRGPQPAPTIPFPLAGATPGLAIIDVPSRKPVKLVALGDPMKSDFHGVAILPQP
jgi:hypothetical protein